MSDALTALDLVVAKVGELADVASATRTKLVRSEIVQPLARSIATAYFAEVRPELVLIQNRQGLCEEIDFCVQAILELAASKREKAAYVGQTRELRPYLFEANIDLLKAKGSPRLVVSSTERAILDTLAKMLPTSGLSYEQALRDFSQGGRISWRGTASELRETLREVIDHLAPDAQVVVSQGFQFEPGLKGPTQKQKVAFILRARRSKHAAVQVVQVSLTIVDEAIGALARSTYQRGSASTHASASVAEVRNIKRYVDAVLAELLEIG